MTAPSLSVVVLNRDRIRSLARTLMGLKMQSLRGFELIIVSNQARRVLRDVQFAKEATVLSFEEANVSRARNLALRAAAGEIVAFCDDDAVPEPTWAENLLEPFEDDKVGAVGGRVRGRNGVSVQWGFQHVDASGDDWPVPDHQAFPHAAPENGRVLKTVGTNCAFRRSALAHIGGFDEAFRFFLDETDVNWRLAKAGWKICPAPAAEVHHSYQRSAHRTSERVPKSLFEIGASKAYFCAVHGQDDGIAGALDRFRDDQCRRLRRAAMLGLLPASAVSRLLATLEEGFLVGAQRTSICPGIGMAPPRLGGAFTCGDPPKAQMLVCSRLSRSKMLKDAAELSKNGHCNVTLLDFEFSARPLTVRFTDQGFWHHRGGVFGQTHRSEPLVRFARREGRLEKERKRIAHLRRLPVYSVD